MDFYVIPPLAHLELMEKGDRFFCLAQLYMKSAEYREFFRQKVADGKWVTLDNGAGDHDIVTEEDVLQITQQLEPSEVIPPDILFDGVKTIRNLENFMQMLHESVYMHNVQIFGCPQGSNLAEWLFVYKYMLEHPHVSTIGFSKIAVPSVVFDVTGDKLIAESRNYMYDFLKGQDLIKKPIHLLGMGDPTEMLYYKKDPLIRSTDSCNTVWSAMNGFDWSYSQFTRIKTPTDYFDRTLTYKEYNNAISNIEWFRGLLS